jgi:LemA protein
MSPGLILTLVLVGAAVLLLIVVVFIYNGLVVLRNQYRNAYAQIDVQLKRRHDLIPNLVESVKGYMGHERETLEAVVQARTSAVTAGEKAAAAPGDAQAMEEVGKAEGRLAGGLGRLIAVAEGYPELKASQNMLALQEELTSTENRIGFARQAYNDAVMAYNTRRQTLPSVLLAGLFGFTDASLFEIRAPAEREAPGVSLP